MKYLNRTKIKKKIVSIIKSNFLDPEAFKNNHKIKKDNSIVTIIDLELSKLIKYETQEKREASNIIFYSEEDHSELTFPAFVLDPIDGTKELAAGIGECGLSLAYMNSANLDDKDNRGWIYNPFTGFEMTSEALFYPELETSRKQLSGLVSRTEYDKGLFEKEMDGPLNITPRGSIAFKLGLLAAGACDFVVTKQPKNIWDIAAGTVLCRERGIKLFTKEAEVKVLDCKRVDGPLIWCSEDKLDKILENLIW